MFRKLNTYINWTLFGIPHAAQRKLFPKCNFFSQQSAKSYRKITFLYQKVRDLHFLCHLIWPRCFNFLVHECLSHECFICSFYSVEKKTMTIKWKKNKSPTYLSYFFGACNHQCCTQMYFHTVESVLVTNIWNK